MGTPHRTECYDVFFFDQLSDEAKEKARDWWRGCEASDPGWVEENRQSLEAFQGLFGISTDWEYDAWSYQTSIKRRNQSDEIWELKGVRLAAFLWNNYRGTLVQFKKYGKRRSRIKMEETSCLWTGYCMDETLLQPIRDHIRKPNADLTFGELLENCVDAWGKACRDDQRWQQEDEQVDDAIIANQYEFDVGGKRV